MYLKTQSANFVGRNISRLFPLSDNNSYYFYVILSDIRQISFFKFFRVFLILTRARAREFNKVCVSPLLFVFYYRVIFPVILTHYLLFLSQYDSLNTKSDLFVSFLQSFEKMKNRRVATVSKIIV